MCIIARMKLHVYLADEGLTEAEFGRKIGLSQSQVNRIRRGASPSWKTVSKIERATEGKVTAYDFRLVAAE